jgi:hypothetical protein
VTTVVIDKAAERKAFSEAPGLRRDEQHRYYYGQRGPMPGVTNIIKALDRSGPLTGWAKRETAACAVRNLDVLRTLVETGGKEAAQSWLAGIPDYQRDNAAKLGSGVHAIADAIARGERYDVPEGVNVGPYVTAYQRFIAYMRPRTIYTEALICNLEHGYGGTLDWGLEFPGENVPTLLDIKTGGAYAETSLQLVGYERGEFTATADDPTQHPLPKFEHFGVLQLSEDGTWTLIPYEVGEGDWEAFLACLTLTRWTKERAPYTKGVPYTEGVQP